MERYDKITWDQMATIPMPGLNVPVSLAFSPDNALVTYLAGTEQSAQLALWARDLNTYEARVIAGPPEARAYSNAEELRRERQRVPWGGITHYQFAQRNASVVLIPAADQVTLLHLDTMESEIIEELAGCEDPFLLPDGQRIIFVRDAGLFVWDRPSRKVHAIAVPERAGLSYGLAEYVAQEELDRPHGFFVSADSRWVAFEEVDVQGIEEYPIMHMGGQDVRLEMHRYPFVGKANAAFRLGVALVDGEGVRWFNLDAYQGGYLADVRWTPQNRVVATVLTRDQKTVTVLEFDPENSMGHVLWEESARDWMNITHDMFFLDDGSILTTSEDNPDRTRHVVIRDRHGKVRWLTQGPWMVTGVVACDEAQNTVFIEATKESPLERHLYELTMASGAMRRMTQEPGVHHVTVSADLQWYADQFSTLTQSPVVNLYRRGHESASVEMGGTPITADSLGLHLPELIEIPLGDGTTDSLWACVYRPQGLEAGRKAPVIVSVYGGPHAQMVTREWRLTVDLQAQFFAQHGFLVLKVDNRGSANRGHKFESAVNRQFGTVELQDQLHALHWVHAHYPTDPERVGIYGWSYGGYMTLVALMNAPNVFKVGVAGAPVTDFRYYDTAYTERYMGTDEDNHEGYEQASVLNKAGALSGKLLVIHGLIDENVHFRHTARLLTALTEARKPYSLLCLPENRHMPRGFNVLATIAERRSEFFLNNL